MEYGSFKDFIENTNDDELMDLYVDFLKTLIFVKRWHFGNVHETFQHLL